MTLIGHLEVIVALAPVESVDARAAVEDVVAPAGGQLVVPAAAGQRVREPVAEQRVGARTADRILDRDEGVALYVPARRSGREIDTDRRGPLREGDGVRAITTVEKIVGPAEIDLPERPVAVESVVAAPQHIGPRPAEEVVVHPAALQGVATRSTGEAPVPLHDVVAVTGVHPHTRDAVGRTDRVVPVARGDLQPRKRPGRCRTSGAVGVEQRAPCPDAEGRPVVAQHPSTVRRHDGEHAVGLTGCAGEDHLGGVAAAVPLHVTRIVAASAGATPSSDRTGTTSSSRSTQRQRARLVPSCAAAWYNGVMRNRLRTWLSVLVGGFGLVVVPRAGAVPTLVDAGQPEAQSSSAPGPVELPDRGDCASGRSIEETNGGASSCPPGTWPAPGAVWPPTVRVASGDALVVSFDERVERLAVLLTSNYPPGLMTPDRQPVPNVSLGEVTASSDADDGRRWVLRVPALDLRAQSDNFAVLSVTALGDQAPVNLALTLQTPRPKDFSMGCGPAYFSTSETGYFCDPTKVRFTKGGPPPHFPPPPCPLVTPARPAPEGRRGPVFVGQPNPCPPPGRTPSDFATTTSFGDGTSAATPVTDDRLWLVGGPHTYRRAGTYTATATITDRVTGAVTTLRRPIFVPNAPLTALRSARPTFTENKTSRAVIARFGDGNPLATADDHRATITWGDRTTSRGRVVRVAAGRFAVRADHRYRTAAKRRIVIRVQDDRGAVLRLRSTPRIRGR